MSLIPDYETRVYAGVLGKIIGVYLGRPIEGWPHERIEAQFGEVRGYLHERLNQPLVVSDDDITGTFTFFRALRDYGYSPDVSSAQIGETWLNYIIENRTILWWGGMGMSTEHTAYLRLKAGIPAPASGSADLNGRTVAEQIGAQIFIEGWGLIFPGDPARAVDWAGRAARVSHDGEAVYGAQMIAAMVALAFVEASIEAVLDRAQGFIPRESLISKIVEDVRSWKEAALDWRGAFREIQAKYGYDKFGGACHVVPNHALVILALRFGEGSFAESQMIVNTCGWDTDCNAANVGSILGVLNGLSAFEGEVDWRGPVADRLYLPTADGGRCISDALREAYEVANAGRMLAGLDPVHPKEGARFHFSQPGSVQGFPGRNEDGRLRIDGPGRALTPTFTPPAARGMGGYQIVASPTLTSGQTLRARVSAPGARLCIGVYDAEDQIRYVESPESPTNDLAWEVPDTGGYPIAEVGVSRAQEGTWYLDWLTWTGAPRATYRQVTGSTWREAWVNGVTEFNSWLPGFAIIQNEGTGLLMTGTREWGDVEVSATVTVQLASRAGVAVRVQGMRRYYALVLDRDGYLRLVRAREGDTVLAETAFAWKFDVAYAMRLSVAGNRLVGRVGDVEIEAVDDGLPSGGIGLVLTEGRLSTPEISVRG